MAGYFLPYRVGRIAALRSQCALVVILLILNVLATVVIARLPDPAVIGDGLPRATAAPVVLAGMIVPA